MSLCHVITLGALAAGVLPAAGARAATTTDLPEAQVTRVAEEDAELAAAQAQAHQALPQFLQRLRSRSSSDLDFAVQAKVKRNGLEETLWLTDVRAGKNELVGKLDADPLLLGGLWAGQRLKIELADIVDWVIVERTLTGERIVGGFTAKLMRERELRGIMPEYLSPDLGLL